MGTAALGKTRRTQDDHSDESNAPNTMLTLGETRDARFFALFALKRVPKAIRVKVFQFHDPLNALRKFMSVVRENVWPGVVWQRNLNPTCKVVVNVCEDGTSYIYVHTDCQGCEDRWGHSGHTNGCGPLTLTELWNTLVRPDAIVFKDGKRFPYPSELARALAKDFE